MFDICYALCVCVLFMCVCECILYMCPSVCVCACEQNWVLSCPWKLAPNVTQPEINFRHRYLSGDIFCSFSMPTPHPHHLPALFSVLASRHSPLNEIYKNLTLLHPPFFLPPITTLILSIFEIWKVDPFRGRDSERQSP